MAAFSNQLVSATPPAIAAETYTTTTAALSLVSTVLLPVLLKVFDRRPLARLLTRLVQVPVIYVVDMSETPRARTAALCIPIAIVANAMRVNQKKPHHIISPLCQILLFYKVIIVYHDVVVFLYSLCGKR